MSAFTDTNDVDNVTITRDGFGRLKSLLANFDPSGNLAFPITSTQAEIASIAGGFAVGKDQFGELYFGCKVAVQHFSLTKVDYINGASTCGLGVPGILAEEDLTGQTGAVADICSFTPAADGTFEVGGYVNISTLSGGTSPSVQLWAYYTNENGVSKERALMFTNNGSQIAGTVDDWCANTCSIRAKASTAITMLTTVNGSPTSLNYDVGAHIKQIA